MEKIFICYVSCVIKGVNFKCIANFFIVVVMEGNRAAGLVQEVYGGENFWGTAADKEIKSAINYRRIIQQTHED